jgi:DNA primase
MPTITDQFKDELRARLRASDIIGRYVKLKKQGREWQGLSPFTNEKTPSFYVNDEKGMFFDFSSGRNGDIISFLMDTQKLTFMEAIQRLADEAGMEIPKDSPEAARRAEQQKGLVEACEAAAGFYTAMLGRIEGRSAREYLETREVPPQLQATFGMGYAPAGRTMLKDYLVNKGFQPKMLIEAGLLIQPEDGGQPYDRFRDRVMFPILGPKGRPIAFGGRALDKSQKAKYLNSPETPLFHKGNVLYNYMRARKFAASMPEATGQPLIVCEGYMDVIALAGAGFGNGVAPLGTALTENQIALLWRACDEPVLCFDGDRAGRKAAYRGIDRALPMLKPGKSLRFAFMPEGLDPDDLIKAKGASALQKVLDEAQPLADVLWDREVNAQELSTPERRAAFRSQLRQLVRGIADPDVRSAYGAYFAEKLQTNTTPPKGTQSASSYKSARAPYSGGGFRKGGWEAPVKASTALKSRLGTGHTVGGRARIAALRETLLVFTLFNHPGLFERLEETLLELEFSDKANAVLLAEMIGILSSDPTLDRTALERHMKTVGKCAGPLEQMLANEQLRMNKFACAEATLEEAELGWRNTLSLHLHHGSLRAEETEAASEAFLDETSEARWRVAHSHRLAVVADAKRESDEATHGKPSTDLKSGTE